MDAGKSKVDALSRMVEPPLIDRRKAAVSAVLDNGESVDANIPRLAPIQEVFQFFSDLQQGMVDRWRKRMGDI